MAGQERACIGVMQPYQPGKPIEELERELGIKEITKLASNENPLGCSPLVKTAINNSLAQINLYPDANAFYLKQALAEKLGVDAKQLTIGNGSNDVLELLGRVYLEAGSEAIYSQYAFLVYPLVVQACGASACVTPALPEDHAEQPLGHDLSAMLAAITEQTRMVFIANPNNPTGNWLESGELLEFLQQVPERVIVVLDQAYCEYVQDIDYADAIDWLAQFPNLVLTRTFSKIYGLAALRLGYAISSPQIADLLNRIRQPFNANSLALAAALAALEDQDFVQQSRSVNQLGLKQLQTWFAAKQLPVLPSAGNFITVKFGADAMTLYQKLLREGVIIRPLANYGMGEWLRITIGSEAQNQHLLRALERCL